MNKAQGNKATGAALNSEKLLGCAGTDFARSLRWKTPENTGFTKLAEYIKSLIENGQHSASFIASGEFTDAPTSGVVQYVGDSGATNTASVLLQDTTSERLYYAVVDRAAANGLRSAFAEVAVPREKTWTPYLKGSESDPVVGYGVRFGRYAKSGTVVTVEFQMNITSVSGGSGWACIGGLPFMPRQGIPLNVTYTSSSITGITVTHAGAIWTGTLAPLIYSSSDQRVNLTNIKAGAELIMTASMTYVTNQ